MRSLVQLLILSSLFATLEVNATPVIPSSALEGFEEKGGVTDWFGPRMKDTKRPEISLNVYKDASAQKEQKIKQQKQQVTPQEEVTDSFKEQQPKGEKDLLKAEDVPQTPEQKRAAIMEKYGDPSKPFIVKAQETAPGPLKAYYEAKNAGDDELAAKYLRQYVHYIEDVQKGVTEQVSWQQKIRECEGLSQESDKYPELNWLCKVLREEEEDDVVDQEYLNEEAKKVIEREKKRALNNDLFNNKQGQISISDTLNEKEEIARARKVLANRVPVPPGGFVDVFFYFRSDDEIAKAVASDIERFFKLTKDKNYLGRVNFIAMTIDSYDTARVEEFKRTTRSTFPIMPGADAARAMRITTSPTAVFVATKSGRIFSEVGPRNFYFYSEILNLMKGSAR